MAKAIQAQRNLDDTQRHQERVEWLTGSNQAWACGTPVGEYDRRTLLSQSQDRLKHLAV